MREPEKGERRRRSTDPDFRVSPFTVVIDTREQHPFSFCGLTERRRDGVQVPLVVQVQTSTLQSGDYSVVGLVDRVAVERKSLEDLYSTLTFGRDRFLRELERLASFNYSAVVVEASMETIVSRPPAHTDISPKSIFRSVIALSQRYPKTHWLTLDSRRLAEVTTYRILERFWLDQESERSRRGDSLEGNSDVSGIDSREGREIFHI